MSKQIWLQFNGHGFVTEDISAQTITAFTTPGGTLYDVAITFTTSYVPGQFDMREEVGARVILNGYAGANIPDGTIGTVVASTADLAGIVTIRVDLPLAPIPGAYPGAYVRIEDFYKFCNDVPDFVTGTNAKSRWLQVISNDGFGITLGQKIDIKGGVSSFDGFSVTCLYQNTRPITKLLTTLFEIAVDNTGVKMITGGPWTVGSTLVTKRGAANPSPIVVATDPLFEFEPVFVDKEAVIIQTVGGLSPLGNRELNVTRAVLNTRDYYHGGSSVIFAGLQTAQSAICQLLTIDTDATYYDEEVIYTGIVENVSFSNGLGAFTLEISPQIFSAQKNSFAAKMTNIGVIDNDLGSEDYVVEIEQPVPFPTWRWAKLGDIALKLRPPRDPGNFAASDRGNSPVPGFPGVFRIRQLLDQIAWAPPTVTREGFNNNYVILTPSENNIEFENKSRTFPRDINFRGTRVIDGVLVEESDRDALERDDALCIRDPLPDGDLYDRDGNPSRDAVHMDIQKYRERTSKVDLCHVFEDVITAIGLETLDEYTACYQAVASVNQLILQILLSDKGDGSNGIFDVLPYGVGLGIREDDIDFLTFGIDISGTGAVVTSLSPIQREKITYQFVNCFITGKDTEKINDWLTKKILQPLNLAIVQRTDGKITIVDTSDLNDTVGLPSIGDADIEYDFGGRSLDIGLSYDASNLFDRITIKENRIWINPADGQELTTTIIPSVSISDDFDETGIASRLFSFLQAEPLTIDVPYRGFESVSGFQSAFSNRYSSIVSNLSFTARSSLLEVGAKFSFTLSNVISQSGQRGVSGFGIVIDKKTNILAGQSKYTCVIQQFQDISTVWAASGNVFTVTANNVFDISIGRYADPTGPANIVRSIVNDPTSFNVGDFILLYDENFIMLSVDALGNPDPREITSIVGTTITIAADFTDGAGVPITPVTDNIIMHGSKSLQTVTPQRFYAFFNDNESTYRP